MGMVFLHGDIIERIPAITSTEGLEYKITTTLQKMNNKISALLNLPDKIKIKLVQSSSLLQIAPQVGLEGLNDLKSRIAEVVNTFNKKIYGQMELIYIDPTLQTPSVADMDKFQRFGLRWPEISQTDGTTIPAGLGILALGMEYGEKSFEQHLLKQSLNLTSSGLQEQFQIGCFSMKNYWHYPKL